MTKMISPAPAGWRGRGWIPGVHRGTDFGYYNADPEGTKRVVSAAAGTVVHESVGGGWNDGWGNQYIIDHGFGIYTTYNHFRTGTMQVDVGDVIPAGTYLGQMGQTGDTDGDHLHFEVRINGTGAGNRVDPGPWLDGAQEIPGGSEPISGTQRRVRDDDIVRRRIGAPNRNAPEGDPLQPGEVGNFKGWVHGEPVDGNDLWYVGISGNYFWSGGFTEVSTHDLPDLNAPAPAPAPVGNQRTVASDDAVRVRTGPSTEYEQVGLLAAGTTVEVLAWTRGEAIDNNAVWFQTSGGWSWSGGFTSNDTSGIPEVKPPDPPKPGDRDNPRGLKEYAPVLPFAKKGLVAPLGFKDGDFSKPMTRDSKGTPPVPVSPMLIDRYIVHHTATTADQLDYFSYMNDRSSCPTWYMRTDGSVFEMIRPQLKPAATGPSWNYRSVATETQNTTGAPTWEVSDAQLETHAQIVAWLAEFDGKELDGIPVSFKIDREHVIGHNETGFATACPGPYLASRLDSIVARARAIWEEKHPPEQEPGTITLSREFIQGQIDLWSSLE